VNATAAKSYSISMDFICAQRDVWEAATLSGLYGAWHFPREGREARLRQRGGAPLLLGAKLSLAVGATGVVTAFEPMFRLAVSAGSRREELLIRPADFGCRVTLSVSWRHSGDQKGYLPPEEILASLKDIVYSRIQSAGAEPKKHLIPTRAPRRLAAAFYGLLQGYRFPIIPKNTPILDSVRLSSMADHSNIDVVVHLRAGIAAAVCAALLFITFSFTSRFERADTVPSTGMSLTESPDVNKENASRIYIGQYQSDLELMLNCRGMRLSNTDFYYVSKERAPGGQSSVQLVISYDAHSKVRTVRFVDNAQKSLPLSLPLSDVAAMISPGMTPSDIEAALGHPISAFILDKNGAASVYLGVLERFDRINSAEDVSGGFAFGLTAELVITVDPHLAYTDVQYYAPYDPANPLPLDSMTEPLQMQYGVNLGSYRADRAACERILLFLGRPITDIQLMLNTEPSGSDLIDDGLINYYLVHSRAVDERRSRYLYSAEVGPDNIVRVAGVVNRFLEDLEGAISYPGEYGLKEGMTLYEVYDRLGALPTCAVYDSAELVLCFGRRVGGDRDQIDMSQRRNFELGMVFSADGLLLEEIHINV
jgi:hypothetical protein